MELPLHVSHDFAQMSVENKTNFGTLVIQLMGLSPVPFDKPKPTLAVLTNANDNLIKANQDFKEFGPSKKQALEGAEKEWVRQFRLEASYVDGVAEGVGSVIQLSAFHITKTESNPAQHLGSPQNVDMFGDSRQKGHSHSQCDPLPGAKGYLSILATADVEVIINGEQIIFRVGNSVASVAVGTHKSFEMNLLPSHTEMKGRMAAFNTAGMSDFSTPQDVNIS